MTMLRPGLLLILVLALCAKRGESSSRPEKWRQKLKAVLFEYKTKGEGEREPTRQGTKQCGGSTGIVCCDNSANVDSPCLANVTQMFKNIKKAMEFRINQLDNFDEKFKRLGRVLKLLKGKSSKNATFNNATEMLAKALGGDMKNPTCEGLEAENQISSSRSLPESINIYKILNNCPADVVENCSIPAGLVYETLMGQWQDCADTSSVLINKTIECQRIPSEPIENGEKKCSCWQESVELVESFKEKKCLSSIEEPVKKLNKDVKNSCLSTYQECKKKEDDALFMINACDHQDTVVVGNSRFSRTQDEDWEDDEDELW